MSSDNKEASSLNTAYSETREQKRSNQSSSQQDQDSGLKMDQGVFSPREQITEDYGDVHTLRKIKCPRNDDEGAEVIRSP